MPVISATHLGGRGKRDMVPEQQRQRQETLCGKINYMQKDWGMTLVVVLLDTFTY
jgi:hypothetical protein